MNIHSIHQFLHQRDIKIREKGARHTHTSIQPAGKYLIEGDNIELFWQRYCEECHDVQLCITEKPEDVMPVLCDVDIKIQVPEVEEGADIERLYTEDMVLELVKTYQSVLFEIVEDLQPDDFLCCVLEKNPYFIIKSGKTYKKNGFHLHFPRIFLPRYIQETELVPRIIQEVKKKNISKTFVFEKCIDTSYCKGAGWLLYGSSKASNPNDPVCNPYEISYCIDHDMEKINYKQALSLCKIYRQSVDKINFSPEEIPLTPDDVEYYLPRILSIFMGSRNEYLYTLKSDLVPMNELSSTKNLNKRQAQIGENIIEGPEGHLELAEKLLELLGERRSDEHNEWISVGWILFNITNGSNDGFQLWDDFSKRNREKYDHQVCVYEWSRMVKRDMTFGSLKYLAKLDDPEGYKKLMSTCMKPYIRNSLDLNVSHNDLAKALYQKYEHEFVCSSIQFKIWYQFEDHIWKQLEEGITLRQKISEELAQLFVDASESLHKDLKHYISEDNDKMIKQTKERIKLVMSSISKCKQAPFKNHIMREAMEVFFKKGFASKLDSDPHIIAFQNGVYDLSRNEFRDGRPSDYISLKLPIHYRTEFHMNHPDVEMIQSFFVKMFPDKAVREYFMYLSSQVFLGGNQSKIFQIWTGEGDNGKSIMQQLFERMLGPYAIKLPTSLITGKRTQSSAACPELVRAGNGVRFAMLQEPDQKDTINIGILKELSGNDTFFARGLYKEGQEITPMFKLVLICNDPPKLPYNDRATWNRVQVIPFESTFTDDAPESFEEQLFQKKFPKDKDFSEKIPRMIEPFAWLLLYRYRYGPKVPKPDKVAMATDDYKRKNDIYKQFIDEFIIPHKGSRVNLIELYDVFKDWFRQSMPTQSGIPNKNEVKEYFSKIWGEPVDKIFWENYEIRNAYDLNIMDPSNVSLSSNESLVGQSGTVPL